MTKRRSNKEMREVLLKNAKYLMTHFKTDAPEVSGELKTDLPDEVGIDLAIDHKIALRLGLNILEKWQCNAEQKRRILGFDSKIPQNLDGEVHLSFEQLVRISYLANIHGSLRTMFSNPENTYGFMRMANVSEFFGGKSPLEKIEAGELKQLAETCRQIGLIKIQ